MKQVIYVASPESQQIHVWQLHDDGKLTLLQHIEVDGQVQPMVINPKKPLLYVGVRPNFRVVTYHIDQQGFLKELAQTPLPGSPTYLSTDHEGRYLFSASYNDACVTLNILDEPGIPQAASQVIGGLDGCHSANVDVTNSRLFVPVLKQDRICIFDIKSDGTLDPYKESVLHTNEGAGPRHMAFHPAGKYAYCINELNSSVDVWLIDSNLENIRCVQQLDIMQKSFQGERWGADIHITPDGRCLYACDRTSSLITIMSVSQTGQHLVVEGYQPTEMQPRGFNIDKQGQYLVAAGQKSDHIAVYRIGKEDRAEGTGGLLTLLERYPVGKGPMWVVFSEVPQ